MDEKYYESKSDYYIGKKGQLKRYLICSMQGYFPVIVKETGNSIYAIFRTGGTHVSVSATLAVAASHDGGKSWSDPLEITKRWEDSRNPAFGVNDKGELIAAFIKARYYLYKENDASPPVYSKQIVEERVSNSVQNNIYVLKSKDSGKTWHEREPFHTKLLALNSPYGRIIQSSDGSLLMSVYGMESGNYDKGSVSVIVRSVDGGDIWADESIIARGHNETSIAILDDGSLIAAARSDKGYISVLHSIDLGRTWSEPVKITEVNEHPADIIQLKSGKLLLTYGKRTRPMGCGALVSSDNGHTWDMDAQILLAGDGIRNFDLGYPSTVQLNDGKIITAIYYASGSESSQDIHGWGEVSCQAIHYTEADITF